MEDYLPHKVYYGHAGRIQSFLDSMTNLLYPKADSKYFREQQSKYMLTMVNTARNLALCDIRMSMVIKKMNWYVEKVIELITENKCDYNGYCIFLEANAYLPENSKYRTVEIEVSDCADNKYYKQYKKDYQQYVKEENYLKRDYSDKLFAYTCNLLELYGRYFEKDRNYIGINIHMNGDKCWGGRGYIAWE